MKKAIYFLLVFLLMVPLLAACGGTSDSKSEKTVNNSDGASEKSLSKADMADEGEAKSGEVNQVDRKIIYTAEMHVTVKNIDKAKQTLFQLVNQKGGMITSQTWEEDEDNRWGSFTVKIPQENFNQFINEILKTEGVKVTSQSSNSDDKTKTYVDLQARLKAKEAVKDQFLEFLKQAKKVEELLNVQTELGKVQEEIESLKAEIQFIDQESAMSTVTFHVTQASNDTTKVNTEDLDTWGKLKNTFAESINSLLAFLSWIVVFVAGRSPIIAVLLLLAGIAWFIYRRIQKKQKQDKKTVLEQMSTKNRDD